MTRTWLTADLHLGHANVIQHCDRPFGSVGEMDAELVARWNAVVQPGDVVWMLGDFCFRSRRPAQDYLDRLHGIKHLVVGNHDNEDTVTAPGWSSVQQIADISVDGFRLVLCHYAMRTWQRQHHGTLHLYGHSHGLLPADRRSLDVGVDCWDYRPVSLPEIRERMASSPERALRMEHVA